jgi:ribosomal protein S18 acetylase RimI-like enzyme
MKFELLDGKKHDRKAFDCGVKVLNLYLQQLANQDQKRGLTRVYVLADGAQIVGYYSISAHSVPTDELPEQAAVGCYADAPFLLLGRLAVDKCFQGQGFGNVLIFHAFKITAETAERVGILGMVVDAKDEKIAVFYERFGFRRLARTKNRLVLPFSVLKTLLG